MAIKNISVTGKEVTFSEDEIIVSKTDLKGKITYANDIFLQVSGYEEHELIGKPHNLIRHPDMPAVVFKFLWDRLQSNKEVFAYVVNRAKNGDHYWVLAHVTPWLDGNGNITGYHSSRRVPRSAIVKDIFIPLYKKLLDEERRHSSPKEGMVASGKMLFDAVHSLGYGDYEEFIHHTIWSAEEA